MRRAISRPRPNIPTHCSFSHAGSPASPWVARSPVAFLVAALRWPPDRCAARLDFLWSAGAREAATLVSSGGLLPAGTGLDTSLDQHVGRLNHERTTVTHWQSPGTPQPTPRLPGQLLCDYHQTFSTWSSTRLGRVTLAGPTPVPYGASWAPSDDPDGAVTALVCMTTGAGQTPGPFWCPVTPSFGGPPAAGRQRVFSWVASSRVVKSRWEARMWSAIEGVQVTWACSHLSPPVPGPHGGRGSHLSCSSVGLLR